jgi:hypothetical protein
MSETLTRHDFRPSIGWPPALARSSYAPGHWKETATQQNPAALTRMPETSKIEEFRQCFSDAVALSKSMADEDEAAPFNLQTWTYAAQQLNSLVHGFDLPMPLLLPLQNGGLGAEWHEKGLNIELRFRSPFQVYAVLEDAKGKIGTFQDYDPNLERSRAALQELGMRGRP